jgi:hypothetical protein
VVVEIVGDARVGGGGGPVVAATRRYEVEPGSGGDEGADTLVCFSVVGGDRIDGANRVGGWNDARVGGGGGRLNDDDDKCGGGGGGRLDEAVAARVETADGSSALRPAL